MERNVARFGCKMRSWYIFYMYITQHPCYFIFLTNFIVYLWTDICRHTDEKFQSSYMHRTGIFRDTKHMLHDAQNVSFSYILCKCNDCRHRKLRRLSFLCTLFYCLNSVMTSFTHTLHSYFTVTVPITRLPSCYKKHWLISKTLLTPQEI